MKVRYVGESFGVGCLTDGVVYDCIEVAEDSTLGPLLRIIDDEGDVLYGDDEIPGYLYSAVAPGPWNGSSPLGKWEIVEDNEAGTLKKLIP